MKKLLIFMLVALLSGVVFAQKEEKTKAYLGVMAVEVDDALALHLNLDKKKSFIIKRVVKDTPASVAGLEMHDIILKVNNEEVDSSQPLASALKDFKPEDKVNLEIIRAGKVMALDVTLGESAPKLSLADMKDRIKLIVPNQNGNPDIKIHILENMEKMKEFQKQIQESFNNRNGGLNEEIQKALEQIANANKDLNHFQLNSSMSTVMSTSDGDHNVTVTIKDGNKSAVVRDSSGKIIFEGDINTDAELEAIPAEIREKIKGVQNKVQILPRKFH